MHSYSQYGVGSITKLTENGVKVINLSSNGVQGADPIHAVYGYEDGRPGDIITMEVEVQCGADTHNRGDSGAGFGFDIRFDGTDYTIRSTANLAATRNKNWTKLSQSIKVGTRDVTPRLTAQQMIEAGISTYTITDLTTGITTTNTGSSTSSGGMNYGGHGGLTFPAGIRYAFWLHLWFGTQTFAKFRNFKISVTRTQ